MGTICQHRVQQKVYLRLTRAHRVGKLQFAREHMDWGLAEWSNVLIPDESRYCLYSYASHSQFNFRHLESFGGESIMVGVGFPVMDERTYLVAVNQGRMTADRYIRDILESHVIPYGSFVGENFVFMRDNARPHTARIVNEYLNEVNVPAMNRPARSPDMNTIEHVWDHLGWAMQQDRIPCRTLDGHKNKLDMLWKNIGQGYYIQNLYEGMPGRMQAVITARGGNTRH